MGYFGDQIPSINAPEIIMDLPLDQDDWECVHWKVYYNRIKRDYSKEQALETVKIDAGNIHLFGGIHMCKYDCDFVRWAEAEGLREILGSKIFSSVFCAGEDVTEGVQKTTNVLKYALPVAGVGVSIYLLYQLFKGSKNGEKQK